ncbi:MAG TPA: NTP transferase domain-containing protein [Candidatus Paceibacterota bacterium]
MSRVGVIIQARTGSKRFPGKVLANLAGKPVIQHVVERCREFGEKTIIVAPHYDVGVFTDLGVRVFYGPEDDVLTRYFRAARAYRFDPIVRITADCPLIRPDLMEKTYKLSLGCTYAAIDWPRGGFPKGYGCEIFTMTALELANAFATDQYDREHVTPWMQRNLRCRYLQNDKDESHLNYCVDVPEDIGRLEQILGANKR